jgi:molybdopterin-guanine dinucleotide biosynthesis protein
MINGGIFGPKLSGKTTLAKALSKQFWQQEQRRTLVLDPHGEVWGEHAMVFTDEAKFWKAVWSVQNCLVIVEEAAATIRRERTLVPVFTRMRHNNHKLLVIGHSGMDLLPVMRQQLDMIFLFRQPESAAKVWSETFTEKGLLQSQELKQYEFIRCAMYHPPQKMKLQQSQTKLLPAE